MKLEYVPDNVSGDAPLVRLYSFETTEAGKLHKVFTELATESTTILELHHADFIDPINGCQLTLTVDRRDLGLTKTNEPATFRCALTSATWHSIEGLTEPFTQHGACGFQWLNESGIPLLLSSDGHW